MVGYQRVNAKDTINDPFLLIAQKPALIADSRRICSLWFFVYCCIRSDFELPASDLRISDVRQLITNR